MASTLVNSGLMPFLIYGRSQEIIVEQIIRNQDRFGYKLREAVDRLWASLPKGFIFNTLDF